MRGPPRAWTAVGRRPALVLGRSQHALQPATPMAVRRRASGGGVVLIGPWMLRSLVRVPTTHAAARDGPAPLARWTGNLHLQWLASLGLQGARLHEGRALNHWACFLGRGPGEILVDDRKLVGIAQAWHRGTAWVWSAVLLHPPPWALLGEAFGQSGTALELARQTVSLEECLGTPPGCAHSLRSVLQQALDR